MKTRDIVIITLCTVAALVCIALTFWGNIKNDGILTTDSYIGVVATLIGVCATIVVGFQIASFVKIHETEKQIKEVKAERDAILKEKEDFLEDINLIRRELSNICIILSDTIPNNDKIAYIKAKVFTQILSISCMIIEESPTVTLNKYKKLKNLLNSHLSRKIIYPPICVNKLKKIRIPDNIEHYTEIMKLHIEIIEILENVAKENVNETTETSK